MILFLLPCVTVIVLRSANIVIKLQKIKLKNIIKICLLMSAFSVNAAFAVPVLDREVMVIQQGRTLTGTVVDNFGDPVIGANVIVKGTTIGNITDVNGTFTVENVPDDAVLQISYIGFKTLEVPVKGQTTFNITLQEDTENLQEVVVVGYGSSVKKDLTTAVMVDGKVAGVVVNSVAAADPNKSGSIQVRGASSLKAGNSPLIVIDGMPGGDLRNLAQSDIESITVLKDGSMSNMILWQANRMFWMQKPIWTRLQVLLITGIEPIGMMS